MQATLAAFFLWSHMIYTESYPPVIGFGDHINFQINHSRNLGEPACMQTALAVFFYAYQDRSEQLKN